MRALKAILTACGNLRRKLEDWEEDKLGLRALNDVNKPKFTQNDVDLYAGITADLFPNVVLPVPDYSTLTNAMLEQCALTNL
jgi:dynein heavy chain